MPLDGHCVIGREHFAALVKQFATEKRRMFGTTAHPALHCIFFKLKRHLFLPHWDDDHVVSPYVGCEPTLPNG